MLQPRWSLLSWSGSKSGWTRIWPSLSRWTPATLVVQTCLIISRSCSAALQWRRPIASWLLKSCCTRRASELPRNSPARLCHFSRSYHLFLSRTLPSLAFDFISVWCWHIAKLDCISDSITIIFFVILCTKILYTDVFLGCVKSSCHLSHTMTLVYELWRASSSALATWSVIASSVWSKVLLRGTSSWRRLP